MTDSFDPETDAIDFEEFQTWIDEVAAAEGSAPGAVLDDLISTYWILNEITEEVDPDLGAPESPESAPGDRESTEIVETVKALSQMLEGWEDRQHTAVDPELIRLLETVQGSRSGAATGKEFDVLRLEQRLGRNDDRLSDLADDVASIRTELASLSSTIDEVATWDPSTMEQRQDALEEVVGERIDWLEEKVDALYLELFEAIEDQENLINTITEDVETVEGRTQELSSGLDSERRKRQTALRGLREDLQERIKDEGEQSEQRLQTIRASFQDAIDEIESYLHDLYDRDAEVEERVDEVITSLDAHLEPLVRDNAERAALETLLTSAQEDGVRTARCRSCEGSVDLGLLSKPRCPYCERVFADIETNRHLLWTRHDLATKRPGYEFDVPSLQSLIEGEDEEAVDDSDSVPDLAVLDPPDS